MCRDSFVPVLSDFLGTLLTKGIFCSDEHHESLQCGENPRGPPVSLCASPAVAGFITGVSDGCSGDSRRL